MKFEADIIEFFQTNLTPTWITVFQIITLFGSFLGFILTFILLFIKNKKLSYIFAITFVVAQICNKILKLIIARDRPFEAYESIINYGNEDGFSMPSGHSMSAGLFATFLIYMTAKQQYKRSEKVIVGITISIVALAVAFSRIVLGVHYLTDTIVGLIVGILFALLAIFVYNTTIKKTIKRIVSKE